MMRKRRFTQLICAVLYNCNLTGFYKGRIYQGRLKGVCVPGLNCYSCPGAVTSCPLGSLQNALAQSRYQLPYYMLGILLLMGLLLGRFCCGFLCPFGMLQELLYKLPVPKAHKNQWTRRASYIKYFVLAILVIVLPLIYSIPAFCKYLCPAGTLEAGIPLVLTNEPLRKLTGALFSRKVLVLLICIAGSAVLYRFFCRFLCPLGAFYSLFQKTAVVGMKVDADRCIGCGKCVSACKLDVRCVGDHECVDCAECQDACPFQAISLGIRINSGKQDKRTQSKSVS